MQIGNPLPQVIGTVQIGGVTAPGVLATQANLTIPNNTSQVSTSSTTQISTILSNQDLSATVFLTDTSVTTFQVGTSLGPGQVAVLDGAYPVRIANNSGAAVTVGVNTIKSS